MSDQPDARVRKLRHDIASPLAAILAETQLLLLNASDFDEETVTALQTIETAVRRIRDLLAES